MRLGRPKSLRLNALLAVVAGATLSQTIHRNASQPEAPPVAVYTRSHYRERQHRQDMRVPQMTKRGVRRAQTRGRR